MVINKFDGEYAFLSNYYDSPITYKGYTCPTVEHAFHAAKTDNEKEVRAIVNAPTPGESKRLGRQCTLRPDWEEVKDNIMRTLLCKKFAIPELRDKLLATGDAMLIEGTTWHDNYWGVCSCEKCGGRGKNRLGELLMEIRKELREG